MAVEMEGREDSLGQLRASVDIAEKEMTAEGRAVTPA